MSGGVSSYAAICARVRVKYSRLLGAADLRTLAEAPDLKALLEALKRTAYGSDLENLRDGEVAPASIVASLRGRQAAEALSVIQGAPGSARPVLVQLHRQHEVSNLKAVLRGIATAPTAEAEGRPWDRIRILLYPTGAGAGLPFERMLESGSIGAAIELLRGTAYHEPLSFALKRYSSEQSLFPLEVALDLSYWRRLWEAARKLSGEDQAQAVRLVGSLIDVNNLLWAIRYRVYKHLSEEELINYTLPFGHRVTDVDIRAIAAGGDIVSILRRLYPEVGNSGELLEEPRRGLPLLEVAMKRLVAKRCAAAFLGNPFHVGLPLAYLIMHDLEIQDLIVLIEAKAARLSSEQFQPFILAGVGVAA